MGAGLESSLDMALIAASSCGSRPAASSTGVRSTGMSGTAPPLSMSVPSGRNQPQKGSRNVP